MTERNKTRREAWITGIGIVSSLGEGLDAHWAALNEKKINFDDKRFAAQQRGAEYGQRGIFRSGNSDFPLKGNAALDDQFLHYESLAHCSGV